MAGCDSGAQFRTRSASKRLFGRRLLVLRDRIGGARSRTVVFCGVRRCLEREVRVPLRAFV